MENKSVKNHIGASVYFNEHSYSTNCRAWQAVIGAINEIAAVYLSLNIGDFSKSILLDLYVNSTKNVSEQFYAKAKKQFEKAGIDLKIVHDEVYKNIDKEVAKLIPKIQNLKDVINHAQQNAFGLGNVTIDINDAEIADNKAALTDNLNEKIKLENSIIINTERQSRYYDAALRLIELWNQFVDEFVSPTDLNRMPLISSPQSTGTFVIDIENNRLQIEPNSLTFLS